MSSSFVVSQQFIVFADEPITGNSECYFKILGLVSWGGGGNSKQPMISLYCWPAVEVEYKDLNVKHDKLNIQGFHLDLKLHIKY